MPWASAATGYSLNRRRAWWLPTQLGTAGLGQVLGLGGGATGAGYVAAGTKIIVLRETVGAHVNLVNFAMDHRQVTVANIATATDSSSRVPGFSRSRLASRRRLNGTSFEKNARGRGQRAEGDSACTQDEKTSVRMFAQCRGQHDQSDARSQRSQDDQPGAHL
jgi:hypothetical protein